MYRRIARAQWPCAFDGANSPHFHNKQGSFSDMYRYDGVRYADRHDCARLVNTADKQRDAVLDAVISLVEAMRVDVSCNVALGAP